MLLGDEGNSALHYVDLDAPHHNWTYQGKGRDLQLIGKRHVLRSRPQGYVELDLANRGRVERDVVIANIPGEVESARRLPNGAAPDAPRLPTACGTARRRAHSL